MKLLSLILQPKWLPIATLLTVLLVIGGCQWDAVEWKVAQGLNEYQQGNDDRAIEILQEAVLLAPDNDFIKLRLAQMLAKNGQGDLGLTWCDEVLEKNPAQQYALMVRTECLKYLGRFDEAFREYQKTVANKITKTPMELNDLAYYRGLAGLELDKAARQINAGIRQYEKEHVWASARGVPIHIQAIVSMALLSRAVGGYQHVEELLHNFIVQHRDLWEKDDFEVSQLLALQKSAQPDEIELLQNKVDRLTNQMSNIETSMALLLATRSLVSEGMNRQELSDHDRRWLKKIGFEPTEIYERLPSLPQCENTLETCSMFLDTRGYIFSKLPWKQTWTDPMGRRVDLPLIPGSELVTRSSYADALFDLDLAIAGSEVLDLAIDSSLFNRVEIDVRQVQSKKQESKKMVAVLRYHRLKAHQRAGEPGLVQADRQRIQELGFAKDYGLF